MRIQWACVVAVVGWWWAAAAFGQDSLPANLKWQTNDRPPAIGSPAAVKGGTVNLAFDSFPLTFRNVGPDSNGSFRSYLDANRMGLVNVHPNTEEVIPELATAWAYGDDNKTMYFKINPKAQWSDGKPVTADDFVYTLEFHRSPKIVAPWYNEYFTSQFDRVIKYDGHTIAVVMKEAKPELHLYANIAPTPKHYYGTLGDDFVKKYNWEVVPNTGPYFISGHEKGKSVTFSRKKDWWAKDMPYYQNRFNVDKIVFKVIRETTVQLENLKRGNIDFMWVIFPDIWHDKTSDGPFANGYVEKLMFYTDGPESDYGLELNTSNDLLADINVRLGIQHAVNVERVIEKVLRGDYLRLQGVTQGYGKFTNPSVRARTYDLKLANQHFDKAGFTTWGPDGIRRKGERRLSAKVTYTQENLEPRLVVMREELKKAGFDLQLQKQDGTTGFKSFLEKKHEIAFMAWAAQLRPEYYGRFHSTNADKTQTNNFTNVKDKELDAWSEAYRSSTKLEERINLAHKIQQKIHDLGIIIPLFRVPYFRVAYWRWIKLPEVPGTKVSQGIDLFDTSSGGIFWLDEAAKKETEAAMKGGKKFPPVVRVVETFKPK
jgi:microcin C transport system substrate-binding protein